MAPRLSVLLGLVRVSGASGAPGLMPTSPGRSAFPLGPAKFVGIGGSPLGFSGDGVGAIATVDDIGTLGVVSTIDGVGDVDVAGTDVIVVDVVTVDGEAEAGGVTDDGSGAEVAAELAGLGGGWLATGAGSFPVFPNLSGIA